MKELNLDETNIVNGGGIVAAVCTIAPAVAIGIGLSIPAVLTSPLVAYKKGIENGLYHATLAIQGAYALEKWAYNLRSM